MQSQVGLPLVFQPNIGNQRRPPALTPGGYATLNAQTNGYYRQPWPPSDQYENLR